jgi:hypothetical protein
MQRRSPKLLEDIRDAAAFIREQTQGCAPIAILKSYQNGDGSVDIPKVLAPYMGDASRV